MRRCSLPLYVIVLALSPFALGQADAALINSYASGTGASASLEVIDGVLELGVGPVSIASASGKPAFNQMGSVANVNATGSMDVLGLLDVPVLHLSTGLLESTVTSDVDGSGGTHMTTAMTVVNNVAFSVAGVTPLAAITSLVSLNATVIQSTSTIAGQARALTATGTSLLTGTSGLGGTQAAITVAGVEFLLDAAPDPNTSLVINGSVIPGLIGSLEVLMNEQILTGDAAKSLGLRTNALRLRFNNFGVNLGLNQELLNGDLVIGSSYAVQSTPEPASIGMIALFLMAAAAYAHRRRFCRRYCTAQVMSAPLAT